MAYDGKFEGHWQGEWLGAQSTNPNVMYAALSGSSSVLATLTATGGNGMAATLSGGGSLSASLTSATTPPTTYDPYHGSAGGGGSNGQATAVNTSGWESIDNLFKRDRQQRLAQRQQEDEIMLCAIMQAVTEDIL